MRFCGCRDGGRIAWLNLGHDESQRQSLPYRDFNWFARFEFAPSVGERKAEAMKNSTSKHEQVDLNFAAHLLPSLVGPRRIVIP